MKNNTIEDILIDKDFSQKNKKGKSVVFILIFLIILIVLAIVAYCFFVNKETNKEIFFKGILNAEFNFFIENETYETISQKLLKNSFEMDDELTLNITTKNEETIDLQNLSKFLLKCKTVSNKENEENYNELNLSYADNKLINAKVIDNKEKIAIISDEIINQYIGINKNNANAFFEKLQMQEIMDQYKDIKKEVNAEAIEIDEEYINQKKEQYMSLLWNKLIDEKFTKSENQISLIKENNNKVDVQAYTLSLSATEYGNIVVEMLSALRDDKEFLEKFIVNSYEEKITNDISELEKQEITKMKIIDILNVSVSRKANITQKDVNEAINNLIEIIEKDVKNNQNQNFEMTVYISDIATEKISILFPNKTTIDLEFNSISEKEKQFLITCLYEEVTITNGDMIFSATENNNLEGFVNNSQTVGIKFDIYKSENDASTNFKIAYSGIKDKKVVGKILLDIITKGTGNSKKIDNDCNIVFSNNDGEIKINIKNKIAFDKVSEIEKLTEENCLFLDMMNDEEFNNTIQEILIKVMEVYTNKKESLDFIDTNTQAPSISQNNVNRDGLRELLITAVSTKMGEFQAEGRNYTLQDLADLQITGHMVNVVLQNDVAEISIDGVKFKIDVEFKLYDA